ncbi:hypothetical protein Bealeia1_01928 [Candidatus Bealeia paramacronuclearis]|uniref:Uncharacterized protein n=1 Tax=Candidatus Bealeia paramacronuclearis TaxID=1921001 RepID=A0ABZ2C977_9PROT
MSIFVLKLSLVLGINDSQIKIINKQTGTKRLSQFFGDNGDKKALIGLGNARFTDNDHTSYRLGLGMRDSPILLINSLEVKIWGRRDVNLRDSSSQWSWE